MQTKAVRVLFPRNSVICTERCLAGVLNQFSLVQLLSCVQLFATPWTVARQASLSITNSWSLPKFMSIDSVMPSILCPPLLLLPPIPPSIRVFSNESTLRMRWPKYWSFSFSIISSKEIPGLISFRMDWVDLLAVQGTLKSLLQHHSSKASILRRSAFFTVQLYSYLKKKNPFKYLVRLHLGKRVSIPGSVEQHHGCKRHAWRVQKTLPLPRSRATPKGSQRLR